MYIIWGGGGGGRSAEPRIESVVTKHNTIVSGNSKLLECQVEAI